MRHWCLVDTQTQSGPHVIYGQNCNVPSAVGNEPTDLGLWSSSLVEIRALRDALLSDLVFPIYLSYSSMLLTRSGCKMVEEGDSAQKSRIE